MCVLYYGGYVKIMAIHSDFSNATLCSFTKITVGHCDSDIFTPSQIIYKKIGQQKNVLV